VTLYSSNSENGPCWWQLEVKAALGIVWEEKDVVACAATGAGIQKIIHSVP
jgi:hypothetical protein